MRQVFTPLHQRGNSLLRFLVTVVVLALIIYVGWVTWRSGGSDPRAVFDQEQRQAAHDDARPHFDRALQLGSGALSRLRQLSADTFGHDGLIDQASDWLRGGSVTSPDQAPIQKALAQREAAPTPETAQLEAQLQQAESAFQEALQRYQQAEGDTSAWTPERREHVLAAVQGFARCKELLYDDEHGGDFGVVRAYRSRPDYDRQVGDHAAAMAEHTRRLAAAAQAMAGEL